MSDWFDLGHLAALSLEGPDAVSFAQSQFTADVDAFNAQHWYPLAWCDPRGRALAVMLAARRENEVDLVVPRDQLDSIATRLPMFAIGRDVEIRPGGHVRGTIEPGADDRTLAFDPQRAMKISAEGSDHDRLAPQAWLAADLTAAVPWLAPQTAGRHLPQALGLEALGGLNHDKGCYPGQEVIARVHYLGRVKRHLSGVRFERSCPPPGHHLVDTSGSGLGELLWGMDIDDGSVALAVVVESAHEGSEVFVDYGETRLKGRMTAPQCLC